MKHLNINFPIAGFILGFFMAVVFIGILESRRWGLFGTTIQNQTLETAIPISPKAYYLVEFSEVQDWLTLVNPETSIALRSDIDYVNGIVSSIDLGQYLSESKSSIESVLSIIQATLLSDIEADSSIAGFITCLGLERNPYALMGAGLYLYLQVPHSLAYNIPSGWLKLDQAKEATLTWSEECYAG